ncbi:L-lactate dehydrogenase complex protein LldG [Friedmanniella endophytica]|uniref:L-lactate dehydrogenase complex protein LldG n=1 Tax=Microlunatus kandeliicorticis TaxID=1759536 RepID=A0A7W3INZ8_9ACTN|nr:lactate utilization protein C [Microlunatus kandeliicorticis]MBA8792589.1 L-lactate dehydrogenase complex protein LldG [Microlunatus kandeliicorticis]
MSARSEILARIAAAHRTAPPPDLPYEAISRDYRSAADDSRGDHDQLVELLVDRLVDYKALVRRTDADGLADTVAAALADRGVHRLVRPSGLEGAWLAGYPHDQLADSRDQPLSVAELDGADGVITACAVAVAETGTLILDGSADQGRRAITLVPDYHLCVVRLDQVCADVPQAVARLDGVTEPITMISGPSATSDIELNRVEGVHGPRTLEVIIVR